MSLVTALGTTIHIRPNTVEPLLGTALLKTTIKQTEDTSLVKNFIVNQLYPKINVTMIGRPEQSRAMLFHIFRSSLSQCKIPFPLCGRYVCVVAMTVVTFFAIATENNRRFTRLHFGEN